MLELSRISLEPKRENIRAESDNKLACVKPAVIRDMYAVKTLYIGFNSAFQFYFDWQNFSSSGRSHQTSSHSKRLFLVFDFSPFGSLHLRA